MSQIVEFVKREDAIICCAAAAVAIGFLAIALI
jgi:hypothetical protein